MSVAINVSSLGYPLNCINDTRTLSAASAHISLYQGPMGRIKPALQGENKEYVRSWLVILSNKVCCDPMSRGSGVSGVWIVTAVPVHFVNIGFACIRTAIPSTLAICETNRQIKGSMSPKG